MDRLHSAGWRLYGCGLAPATNMPPVLLDDQGHTRALVLGLAQPAEWAVLARVWQGVQQAWALPAPAIAVSGADALQLWFSLTQPVPAAEGAAWLARLCQTYLADVPAARVQTWPHADAQAPGGWRHAPHWPGQPVGDERWSAFIAPDLAPVFEAEPWLDVAPGADGQADLLARLNGMTPVDLANGLVASPGPSPTPEGANGRPRDAQADTAPSPTSTATAPATPTLAGPFSDAAQFMLAVVNDAHTPLALRIDAAKALLAHAGAASGKF